ncbi:MarR family winged helix-turn-helix transcriptional regulator [Pseudooceanicola sp. LIPI14-2-Ac024]|uniref:MarR family winged helix-turn-helix transcriptional regulator n=1 Tax=Pseudooceanicola sp. LIPI14-2-Ac024 TaxID=3344875 RepID=UPI0035D02C70
MTDDATTDTTGRLIFEVLRLGGRLAAAGDALVGDLGLSSARWQVLSTAAFGPDRLTVSGIARSLGQARQSVQRVVNELEAAGFVAMQDNPAHQRARLVTPTDGGRKVLAEAEARRIDWTASIAQALADTDVAAAEAALIRLRQHLDG